MNAQRKEDLYDTSLSYDTTPLHVEIDSELKKEAESILRELEIPVSTAIEMFYEQIVMLRQIPVDPNLPVKEPLGLHGLTPEELDAALQHSIETAKSGKRYSSKEVRAMFARKYDI